MDKQMLKLVIAKTEDMVQITIDVDKETFNKIMLPFLANAAQTIRKST